jgi:hypothetical protein
LSQEPIGSEVKKIHPALRRGGFFLALGRDTAQAKGKAVEEGGVPRTVKRFVEADENPISKSSVTFVGCAARLLLD